MPGRRLRLLLLLLMEMPVALRMLVAKKRRVEYSMMSHANRSGLSVYQEQGCHCPDYLFLFRT
jgi:hypothetical protein